MSSEKLKYRQDFSRCRGTDCAHKEECCRHEAILEARDNDLAYGLYISAADCIKNKYSELVVCKDKR